MNRKLSWGLGALTVLFIIGGVLWFINNREEVK